MIIALDMNTRSTGVAIFRDEELESHFRVTIPKHPKGFDAAREMTVLLRRTLSEYVGCGNTFVLEDIFLGPNAKTFKHLAGIQYIMLDHLYDEDVYLISPRKWQGYFGISSRKGDTKAQSLEYVDKVLGVSETSHDVADAILQGLHHIRTHTEVK